MKRDETIQILQQHREELGALGVQSLALFGSMARDEATPESDVDLLVEFNRPVGLFEVVDLKEFLQRLLGRKVELVTRDAIKRQLRERILEEAIPAA